MNEVHRLIIVIRSCSLDTVCVVDVQLSSSESSELCRRFIKISVRSGTQNPNDKNVKKQINLWADFPAHGGQRFPLVRGERCFISVTFYCRVSVLDVVNESGTFCELRCVAAYQQLFGPNHLWTMLTNWAGVVLRKSSR